jgi:Txe/YoeB family toxin of Txe-Axe toxin-antitoxin module
MSKNVPNKSQELFVCKKCDYKCSKQSEWDRHTSTAKHTERHKRTNVQNCEDKYTTHIKKCLVCDYVCGRNYDLERHNSSTLHKKRALFKENGENASLNDLEKELELENSKHKCLNCDKVYSGRSSLWYHKKQCVAIEKPIMQPNYEDFINIINKDMEIKTFLIEQNKQLMIHIMEQNEINKNQQIITNNNNNTTNNNNNTTNNNTFCINVFLNDKCKDAINMDDFVDSLQLKLKDLEETARLGYSDGISRIFINGLNELDLYKRPIHCSDLKRETIYIKDHDIWEKDDSNKTKLTTAIRAIGRKNMKQIFEWQKLNPEYNDSSSKQSDRYHKMICNVMNGSTNEEQETNLNKIIRNITKEIVINKG